MRKLFLLALTLFSCLQLSAESKTEILVNEVQVGNIDQFIDHSYNYGAWIELYNPTEETISISGWYLSDDPDNLMQAQLSKAEYKQLGAGEFVALWFDHNSNDGTYGNYAYKQLRMKLSAEGGTLYISDSTGELLLTLDYPAAISRCSWARTTDGGDEWGWSADPTPGASNSAMSFATEQLAVPTISADSQLYSGTLTTTISVDAGSTLVYTDDGTVPAHTNGTVISADSLAALDQSLTLSFRSSKALRFRTFRKGYLPSEVVTRSYLFKNNKSYTLPIVSVVTDPRNLYNDTIGIYTDGTNGVTGRGVSYKSNRNMDWERPVNFDYITADNLSVINQECTFYISGGWSRHWTPSSFKLKAEKRYQLQNTLDYQFFDEKPYNKHKVVLLRNGGNDTYSRCRDVFVQRMIQTAGMYVDTQEWNPCHVFINGSYLASLNMREPNNKFFAYSNYGIDTDEVDAFEYAGSYAQKAGTRDKYTEWQTLTASATDAAVWEQIRDIVDVDEFCNYMATETYIGGNDWLTNGNNIKGFRDQNNGRFHLVMFDTDACFAYNSLIETLVNYTSYTIGVIFSNMLKNSDFQRQFINAYCLADGSVFTDERAEIVAQEIADVLTTPLALDNRWPWSTLNDVKNALKNYRSTRMSALRKAFSLDAPGAITIEANIPEAALTLDGQPIPLAKFNGKLFAPYTLSASAPAGYNFDYWTKDGKIVSYDRALSITKNEDCALVAHFYEIYDDYKLSDGVTPIVVNEVSAKNSIYVNEYFKRNDWIELYNTTGEAINVEGMFLTDDADDPEQFVLPAAEIPAKGYLIIWADKLDPLSQLHANFKLGNDNNAIVMLTAADHSWSNTLTYNAHTGMQSVGRYPDGGRCTYLMTTPTIGKANTIGSYAELLSGSDVNAINSAASEPTTQNSATLYNLAGQRVNERVEQAQHGVFISGGRKVVK